MPPETQNLKQEISETREELGQNLSELEGKLKRHWTEVKRTFSPTYQTERHPWVSLGVSVATGVLLGAMVGSRRRRASGRWGKAYASELGASMQSRRERSSGFPHALRSGLRAGVGRGRDWLGRFDDEVLLVKNLFLTSLLEKVGAWAKSNFPKVEEPIDRVLQSALTKVKPTNGARAAADRPGSTDEMRSHVVGARSGGATQRGMNEVRSNELQSKERSWRPSAEGQGP